MIETEIAVIGGGIAGLSAAAEIAATRAVIVLEREEQPGYHASGRSAALFSEAYGNAPVRALSVASRAFLAGPPEGFSDYPILTPRGALHVGGEEDAERLARTLDGASRLVASVRGLDAAACRALVPVLRPDWVRGGVYEPDAQDIDTHALLSGYRRLLGARGGRVLTRAEVTGLARDGTGWRIETSQGEVRAGIVVNAAGAWADAVADLAGLRPLGLRPLRRTAFLFEPPPGVASRDWPITIGASEDFYFKPDAGLLLGSPADETPSEPVDAQPEELDVAVAVDRIETVTTLQVRRVARRWAGLRTFAPDRTPVAGFDPAAETFFWLAGQGGYGFQTGPAMARIAGALVCGRPVPAEIEAFGLAAPDLAPGRFAA